MHGPAILNETQYRGFKTKSFPEPIYRTRAANKGSGRSYVGWGRGMKDCGYYPPLAIGRILKIAIAGHLIQALRMLRGYIFHKPMLKQEWMEFNRKQQKERLKNGIKKILRIG